MAITVNIYYTGDGDNARKFAKEMISGGTVDSIRKEKGNLKYEYFTQSMMKKLYYLLTVGRIKRQ